MVPDTEVVTPATLRAWPLPEAVGGKTGRGRLAVVGGSATTPGAALLAGEAALRAGAGKLSFATVESVVPTLAVAVPESLVVGVPASSTGSIDPAAAADLASFAESADVVLLGPGFTDTDESVRLLASLAPNLSTPVVLDALGSAFLTEHPKGLRHLDGQVVLNVNPTELSRTAGRDEDEVAEDPYDAALEVAGRSQVVVLCGGEDKLVVTPEGGSWRVQGGGPGLGVSGSGDVQAGILAGLLARGADPARAAVWGGYLHARSGERLAASVGTVGYLARELPAEVPQVLTEVG